MVGEYGPWTSAVIIDKHSGLQKRSNGGPKHNTGAQVNSNLDRTL